MQIRAQSRRGFIRAAILTGGTLILAGRAGAAPSSRPASKQGPELAEEEVGPNEDLMREHGVLRRVLLIQQESARRIEEGQEPPIRVLQQSASLVRRFVEDYHEKLEEDYLFPRFRKAGRLVEMVDILQQQHKAGRRLTDVILQQTAPQASVNPKELVRAIRLFARMYQPHAAREDTVLFPALHEVISPAEYQSLGETFEDQERDLFGQEGFERIVGQVAGMEKIFGIYDLAQFTPKA